MIIDRVGNEYIIRIPATTDIQDVQAFLDYLRYKDLTARSVATNADVDTLVASVKESWRDYRNPKQ